MNWLMNINLLLVEWICEKLQLLSSIVLIPLKYNYLLLLLILF